MTTNRMSCVACIRTYPQQLDGYEQGQRIFLLQKSALWDRAYGYRDKELSVEVLLAHGYPPIYLWADSKMVFHSSFAGGNGDSPGLIDKKGH